MRPIFTNLVVIVRRPRSADPGYGQDSCAAAWPLAVPVLTDQSACPVGVGARSMPRKPHGEVPDPHLQPRGRLRGANARAAGPDDEGSWAFAEAVVAQTRPDPRDRRLVVHSDGHLSPRDAAGAQTITDGPFARAKGGDVATPMLHSLGSCRGSHPTIAVVVSRLPNTCE